MLKYAYRKMYDICGADFKLDVGLYQLDQQVACQRYRQTRINADTFTRVATAVKNFFAPSYAFATA